ncbi:threonylcarbamoyl-AMP synthase-like [Macrosteles quadrilineatus]|uniref:threonylcarbamoyl-AMP synthase-like n=1 Tax=Macrosteles quadrilineatus TaxID=74068 RepID=UPI0023E25C6D|nr:threonylcarbamoyl-AMP synthase-like [Macrosteles quadrilineatus]
MYDWLVMSLSIIALTGRCRCGEMEKIEWNVVKLGGKDLCNTNLMVALDSLRKRRVVGLPTDTVYGFIADATRPRPIEKLYNITGPLFKDDPITIAVEDITQLSLYADIDYLDRGMIGQLLPGMVTVIFRRRPNVLPYVNPNHEVLPVRIPGKKGKIFLRKVIKDFGAPVALVGARTVPRPHSRVIEDLEDIRLNAYVVYDGGKLERRRMEGSTIVDLSVPGRYKILWPGCVENAVLSVVARYELEEWTEGPNITVFNPT